MNEHTYLQELVSLTHHLGLVPVLHQLCQRNIRVQLRLKHSIRSTDIDELSLSVRSQNALRRAGLNTLGQVSEALSADTVAHIRNLGKKSLNEIKTKILCYAYDQLNDTEKQEFFRFVIQRNSSAH